MSQTKRISLNITLASILMAVLLACLTALGMPEPAGASLATTSTSSANAVSVNTQVAKDVSLSYQAKMQKTGWGGTVSTNAIAGAAGRGLKLKGMKVTLNPGATYTGGIKYRIHLASGKWSAWKKNGASLKTSGTIDGFQVKLTGTIANDYDVVYRAYLQDIGWQRRMRNGETAGATGAGLRIEALRVNLVAKSKAAGWIHANGAWRYYKAGKPVASQWVVTDESPIMATTAGAKRYWVDATGTLACDRYVIPSQWNDAKAGWTAYATASGFVATGKFQNFDGLLLANSNGKLYTKTQWLSTKAFDGKKQKYRLVKKGEVAVVQTGLFTVSGKKYYGWEDGRGYVMRSNYWSIGKKWYKANSKGVLKKYTGKTTKLIDRYVNWAIKIAKDNSHGYSQANRWGPDYDCSSLVCASLKATGFPDKGASWTGNMKACLKKAGFVWHKGTKGLRRGDIMLVHNNWRQHTEIYIGNNQLVGAHIAETGGIYGKAGDQTGNEISVTRYYNAPWDGYLRYKG